jgi:hypothetical protein
MLELFRPSGRQLQEQVQQLARELMQLRTDMDTRVQQVEAEFARLRLQRMLREIHAAVVIAVKSGAATAQALEIGLRAATAALPRGRAGGLEGAKAAWRYDHAPSCLSQRSSKPLARNMNGARPVDGRARWAPTDTV